VAEIPALLVGLSAGFVVTRVGGSGKDRSLGEEIGVQILANPGALVAVAVITVLIGFIPGFPTFLFLLLAGIIAGFAWYLRAQARRQALAGESVAQHLHDADEGTLGHAYPLLIELGGAMFTKFQRDPRWKNCFNELYPLLQRQLQAQTGVPYPDLKIVVNPVFRPDRYRIKVYEIPVEDGFLSPEHCVIRDYDQAAADSVALGEGERTDKTVHGTPVMLLHLHRQAELKGRGVTTVTPEGMLLAHIGKVLKRHAKEFIGIQEVRGIIANVEKYHADLVREVVPRLLSWNKLTDLVKRLVEENIPIKDFRLILETLSGCQPDSKDINDLTEVVRMGLKRVITHQYAPEGRIATFHLDPEIEDEVAAAVHKTGDGNFLALAPARLADIQHAIKRSFLNHGADPRDTVITTRPDVRRYLRRIVEAEMPEVAVLSHPELEGGVRIDLKDVISTNVPQVVPVK
jgi:type III secretion protein V